jgi:hypothetical protein
MEVGASNPWAKQRGFLKKQQEVYILPTALSMAQNIHCEIRK